MVDCLALSFSKIRSNSIVFALLRCLHIKCTIKKLYLSNFSLFPSVGFIHSVELKCEVRLG